jgi:hypothetical protein
VAYERGQCDRELVTNFKKKTFFFVADEEAKTVGTFVPGKP